MEGRGGEGVVVVMVVVVMVVVVVVVVVVVGVMVVVGGMGSIPGAALGALVIGLSEQFGSVYFPTYAVVLTFLIMVVVLAFRPQGLVASARA